MFLSCNAHVSEWIQTLYLPECQGTPYSKEGQYLKFKWLQRDSNPEPLSSYTNTQPFSQIDEMFEHNCEYLSVPFISLHVLVMSHTHFTVNPHSIFAWMSRNSLLKKGAVSEGNIRSLSDCNWTQIHNHLVHKLPLIHLTKLANWLSWIVSSYLYPAFDCMFLSCLVPLLEWIHTLSLSEFQGTPYSKQEPYLKFKWLQGDSKPQPLSS